MISSKMAVLALTGFVFCFASVKKVGFSSVNSLVLKEKRCSLRGAAWAFESWNSNRCTEELSAYEGNECYLRKKT